MVGRLNGKEDNRGSIIPEKVEHRGRQTTMVGKIILQEKADNRGKKTAREFRLHRKGLQNG